MALYCPVTCPTTFTGACVGHFITPGVSHLVSPYGQELNFQQVLPTSKGLTARQHVLARGTVLKVARVPNTAVSLSGLKFDGLDVLVIYARASVSSTDKDETKTKFRDYLHFKVFSPEKRELTDLGTFEVDVPESVLGYSEPGVLSVCEFEGPNFGVVTFSNDRSVAGVTYAIDPLNPGGGGTAKVVPEGKSGQTVSRPYWVNSKVLALVANVRHVSLIFFIRVAPKMKRGSRKFSADHIGTVMLPVAHRPRCVGPSHDLRYALLVSDTSVTPIKIEDKTVKEEDSTFLDIRKATRSWSLLGRTQTGNPIYVSDDGKTITAMSERDFKVTSVSDAGTSLTAISPPFFASSAAADRPTHVVRASIEGEKVVAKPLDISYQEYTDSKIVSHESDVFGSSYWRLFSNMESTLSLSQTRTVTNLEICPLSLDVPLIESMFLVKHSQRDIYVFSSAQETLCFELNDSGLKPVSTWYERKVKTLAISEGLQVSPSQIFFEDKPPHQLSGEIIAAAAISSAAILARPTEVLFLVKSEIFRVVEFDDTVLDVAISKSSAVVCTPGYLYVYDLFSTNVEVCELPSLGTMVACAPEGQTYVAMSNGDIFRWPQKDTLHVSQSPLLAVRAQLDGSVFVFTGTRDSVYMDPSVSLLSRADYDGTSDAVLSTRQANQGVALKDGVPELFSLSGPRQHTDIFHTNVTALSHSRVLNGKIWLLDPRARKVYGSSLKGFSGLKHLELPELDVDSEWTERQLILAGPDHLLEVIHTDLGNNNSDEEFDDYDGENFDDETVTVELRLYRISYDEAGDLHKLTLTSSATRKLIGEPSDEVIVKFYSHKEFVIFAYLSEALKGCISPNDSLEFDEAAAMTHANVYDDYWIPFDKSNDVLVCEFTGGIFLSHDRRFDYWLPGSHHSSVSVTNSDQEHVYSVAASPEGGRLEDTNVVAVIEEATRSPQSSIVVFQVDRTDGVKRLAQLKLLDKGVRVVPVSTMKTAAMEKDLTIYAKALTPEVVVSTKNGGIFMLSAIKDAKLNEALKRAQSALREDLGLTSSSQSAHSNLDGDGIDGGLFLEALAVPDLRFVFTDAGLDPEQLYSTLTSMTR